MKTLLQQAILISALIVFGASCGKSKSGKGGGGSPVANLLDTSNLDNTSAQNLSNLESWYNSTTEGTWGTNSGATSETRRISQFASSSNTNCSQKPIKVLGVTIATFTSCLNSGSQQSGNDSTLSKSAVPNGSAKNNNARLVAIFSGAIGQVMSVAAQNGPYGSPLYTVHLRNSSTGAVSIHVIDTGANSAFNPVYIMDYSTQTENSLKSIQ